MRYYLDDQGKRVYTMKVIFRLLTKYQNDKGDFTFSAHPARFSPDDKFSHERIVNKQRHGIHLTLAKAPKL